MTLKILIHHINWASQFFSTTVPSACDFTARFWSLMPSSLFVTLLFCIWSRTSFWVFVCALDIIVTWRLCYLLRLQHDFLSLEVASLIWRPSCDGATCWCRSPRYGLPNLTSCPDQQHAARIMFAMCQEAAMIAFHTALWQVNVSVRPSYAPWWSANQTL